MNKMLPVKSTPAKGVITRIETDFYDSNINRQRYSTIVKNYVYNPQKKVIA